MIECVIGSMWVRSLMFPPLYTHQGPRLSIQCIYSLLPHMLTSTPFKNRTIDHLPHFNRISPSSLSHTILFFFSHSKIGPHSPLSMQEPKTIPSLHENRRVSSLPFFSSCSMQLVGDIHTHEIPS